MPSVSRGGVTIHVETRGEGPPLVLLHGAASSHRSFDAVATHLERDFQLVMPDLRGMGKSARVAAMEPRDWTEDTVAALDELGLHTAHFAGTSLGARVATRIAIDHPERVRSLVVDAPMVYASEEGAAMVTHLFGPERSSEMAAALEHWHGDDWEDVTTTYLSLRSTPGLQEVLDFRSGLDAVTVPTLITRGDLDDPIHPLSDATEYHRIVADTRLWVAPDTGFSLARFRPTEWAGAVREFIASTTGDVANA